MRNSNRYSVYRRGYGNTVDDFFCKPNTPAVQTAQWAAVFPEVEKTCRNNERSAARHDGFYRFDFYVQEPDGNLIDEYVEYRVKDAVIGNWNYVEAMALCLIVDGVRLIYAKSPNGNDATTAFRPLTEISDYEQIVKFRSKQRVAEAILRHVTASASSNPHFHVCVTKVANMLVTLARGKTQEMPVRTVENAWALS